jgi:hypothetical protein
MEDKLSDAKKSVKDFKATKSRFTKEGHGSIIAQKHKGAFYEGKGSFSFGGGPEKEARLKIR